MSRQKPINFLDVKMPRMPTFLIFDHCVLAVNLLGLETFRRLGYFYSDFNFRASVLFLIQFNSFSQL